MSIPMITENKVARFTRLVKSKKTAEQISAMTGSSIFEIKRVAKTLGLEVISSEEKARLKRERKQAQERQTYAQKRTDNQKPQSEISQRKERKCLRCEGMFMSSGPGNRICKGTECSGEKSVYWATPQMMSA